MIETFLLAAGISSRFGQSKALVEINGQTVLEKLSNTFREGGVSLLNVVCKEGDVSIQSEARRLNLPIVYCTPWSPEMSSSVRVVLESSDADWVGICPVDLPFLESSAIKACVAALDSESFVIQPWCDGYKHPVFISKKAKSRVLDGLAKGDILKDVLCTMNRKAVQVSPCFQFRDFDTVEALNQLLEEGQFG